MAMGWLGWCAAAPPTVNGPRGRLVHCNRLATAHIRCCFHARERRRLGSLPPQIFPRILPWKSGFQPGFSAAAGAPPLIVMRSAHRTPVRDGMAH